MQIISDSIPLSTQGHTSIHNITGEARQCLESSGLQTGTFTLFVPGSTAGLTTIEFEPGLVKDIPEALEKIAPENKDYHHHATWGDYNGSAHVRAAMIGPSLVVPFSAGQLQLGTWQQIVLMDFDDRSRHREVLCQIMGQ